MHIQNRGSAGQRGLIEAQSIRVVLSIRGSTITIMLLKLYPVVAVDGGYAKTVV